MALQPFIKKYSPKKMADVIGQPSAVKELVGFIENFKTQKKKAVLLYGDTGAGKTSAVHAYAKEHNLEIVEVNASDFRNEAGISGIVGAAVHQRSLFFQGKIILIDEVDGVSGTQDRGGIPAIANLIEKTTFPLILTANNPWDNKFSSLRSKTTMIEFKALNYLSIANILRHICQQEKIEFDEEAITSIARRAGGDARAAINDLQILYELRKSIKKNDIEALSEREKEETIHNALVRVFKTTNAEIALPAFEYVNMDVNEIMLWLDENLPKEYKKEDLAQAYYYLSRADQFNGRIKKRQHWRFLAYVMQYLTAGIALSKKEKSGEFVKYVPTTRILKIWQTNMKFSKRKEIAHKIALKTHTSAKEAIKSTVPFMQAIFRKSKPEGTKIAAFLDLNEEEVAWLSK